MQKGFGDSGMLKTQYKTNFAKGFLKFVDIFLVITLFFVIREYVNYGQLFDYNSLHRCQFSLWNFLTIFLLSILWNRIFCMMRMYQFRQFSDWIKQLCQIVIASFLGVVAVILCADIMGMKVVNGIFPLAFLLATLTTFTFYRLVVLIIIYFVRTNKSKLQHVVIIGSNKQAMSLSEFLSKPGLGFKIIGFIDDKKRKHNYKINNKLPFLCTLDQFDKYISMHQVDEVLISLPVKSCYDEICKIIVACTAQGIKTRFETNIFDLPTNVLNYTDQEENTSFINYDTNTFTEFQIDIKRLFDIIVSSAALIIFTPLFLIVALIIIIDDGFPVFFIQERIGYNKRRFQMLKFRTMVRNADKLQASLEYLNEADGAAFKITNDARITRIGNFLRKTSLDEFPQFFNVLLGSMSIVGPRPLPLRDFGLFYNDKHCRRFSIKPGITGLWQINGRNEIDFEEWMRLDLQYIDSRNLLLDFKILLKTIPVVITGKGVK